MNNFNINKTILNRDFWNYLNSREITYKDSIKFNTIKPININKYKFFFIIPSWYGLVIRYKVTYFCFQTVIVNLLFKDYYNLISAVSCYWITSDVTISGIAYISSQ